ncbi:glycosyltransferase family 1 protein [Sphingomonas sp. ST-64]|uniref:Glycosyltransferase family 1 protein n=1 Tax=Sphingomonas plantiphila TaxID=3163295 RepID=A0ABW8YJE5_9SPHN
MPVALARPREDAVADRWITLDVSRLLSRARHRTPTGIDRVELAYARALLDAKDRRVRFAAWVPGLGLLAYRRSALRRYIAALERRWGTGGTAGYPAAMRAWSGVMPIPARADGLHLIVSHQHLDRLHRRGRRAERLCVYLHDAIPSEYPEYARPGGAERHRRRLRNSVAIADAILVNSHSTARSVETYMAEIGRRPEMLVAPLGIESAFVADRGADAGDAEPPYFVCVGTIEPRKNHLLLLQLWRALAERLGDATPRLILAGRRGWENENIVDLLERCPALQGKVTEAGRIGDRALARLLADARAVLMPSFAEGFGLPVAEALAAGVPVIASDIPVLRETGGEVPDYIDPLDGPGWSRAVLDYAEPQSPMRAAQIARMRGWRAPTWDAHFRNVLSFLDAL